MRNRRNSVLITIIIIFILIIIGTLSFIVIKTLNENSGNNDYNNIASSYVDKTENTDIGTIPDNTEATAKKLADNPIDFDALQKQNSDIYAWIKVPGTEVNYPILQSSVDDNFYLNHDIYKNYSFPGAIYSQVCNKKDFLDRVTVLYGHNMANGSMFATIHRFSDKSFFDKHKYFYVYTNDRKLTYEIVSVFDYDDRHIMNSFNFFDDKVFQNYLDMICNPRSLNKNVRDGINLSLDDKILVLSTCLNVGEGRYLLQGVLIKDEYTK